MKAVPMMGTIQCTEGRAVQANMKSAAGSTTEPGNAMERTNSGGGEVRAGLGPASRTPWLDWAAASWSCCWRSRHRCARGLSNHMLLAQMAADYWRVDESVVLHLMTGHLWQGRRQLVVRLATQEI